MRSLVRRLLTAIVVVLLGGASAVIGGGPAAFGAVPAQAERCSPSAVTDPVRVSLHPLDDRSGVRAWDFLRVRFSTTLTDGHCAGDAFGIRIPGTLVGPEARTYRLRTVDGDQVAVMRAAKRSVRVRLDDYVESHHGIRVHGWFDVQIDNRTRPRRVDPITWRVNGATSRTPVRMAACDDCERMPTRSALWENDRTQRRTAQAVLSLPAAMEGGQRFRFTVRLGGGQRFRCPVAVGTDRYRHRDPWGDPTDARSAVAASVSSCRAGVLNGSVRVPAGEASRAYLPLVGSASAVRRADLTAVVTSEGYRQRISTEPPTWAGGGSTDAAADPEAGSEAGSAADPSAAREAGSTAKKSPLVNTLVSFTKIPGNGFYLLGGIIAIAALARVVAVFRR